MDKKDDEIENLERARDKFRDQALDLKQEIKWMKKRKGSARSRSRKLHLCSTLGDENFTAPESQFDKIKVRQSILRKNEVLKDIKTLMHDCK